MHFAPYLLQEWWQATSYKFRRMDYYNSDLGTYNREHEAQHQAPLDVAEQLAEPAIEQA